jgi:hypothetical protein
VNDETEKKPAIHASDVSPISGVAPPLETRWKPGQSGNPTGKPRSAGYTLREWINRFAEDGHTEDELRKIARGKANPWPMRAAAERVLRAIESADLADFEELVEGTKRLTQLRSEGVNTAVVKKIKPCGERGFEIELHDRSGVDFDRIIDRTDGRPTTAVEAEVEGEKLTVRIRPISKPDDPGTE